MEQANPQRPDDVEVDEKLAVVFDESRTCGIQSQSLVPPLPVMQRSFDSENKFCEVQIILHFWFCLSQVQSSVLVLHLVWFPSKM